MNDDSSRDAPNEPGRPKAGQDTQGESPIRRQEPVFTDFDEDEDYETADRDTDFVAAYEEDVDEEEYLDSLEDEEPEDFDDDWQVLGDSPKPAENADDETVDPWEDGEDVPYDDGEDTPYEDEQEDQEEFSDDLDEYDPYDDVDDEEVDERSDVSHASTAALAGLASSTGDTKAVWGRENDYENNFNDEEHEVEAERQRWPLGLMIVGAVALVLLVAGGYGVIQQRAETQEEIRQLRATLATAASTVEVDESRQALAEAQSQNEKLRATVQRLSDENRRLGDTIASLENQLDQEVSALYPQTKPAPTETPASAPKPAEAKPAAPSTPVANGNWFVNFSSYSQRSVADEWANKLEPLAGRAIVAASDRDGRTLYRVRIVGLADRAQAQKVAQQLQNTYKLPPLWVGSE